MKVTMVGQKNNVSEGFVSDFTPFSNPDLLKLQLRITIKSGGYTSPMVYTFFSDMAYYNNIETMTKEIYGLGDKHHEKLGDLILRYRFNGSDFILQTLKTTVPEQNIVQIDLLGVTAYTIS